MGTWYVPEIFVPRRLKNGFYPLHFMAAILSHCWDLPLLLTQPAKRLCVTCVMFLFGADKASVGRVTHYSVYAFFCDVQAAFLGHFTALKSSLHNIQFLVLLIYSNKASIIVKQKEPIMPIQAT